MALTKTDLVELIKEKQKRDRAKKPTYQPNAGQTPVHLSDKEIKFVSSGNGAGKTAAAVHEAIWAAKGYHPLKKRHTKVPADVAVVLDKPNKADKVWLKEARKWFDIPKDWVAQCGKPHTSEIRFPNGSVITFYSHDQDPLTFESVELDCAVYDEPPPRHVFVGLRRGTRTKGRVPWHLIIGTPLTAAWLRQEIWEPWTKGELPEAECFRMHSDVNQHNINWEAQERAFAFMTEQERKVRREGQFFDLDGQALSHLLDERIHVMPPEWNPDPDWPCMIAIDPHPSKAHVAVMMTVDSNNHQYVIKELRRKAVARDFAAELKNFMAGHRVIDIVVDSLGNADLTGAEGFKSFIEVLKECGVPCRATTYDEKSDEAFIDRIRSALAIPHEPNNYGQHIPQLRFASTCKATYNDIVQVQWQRNKLLNENKPKLDISNQDYLACVKYILAANFHFKRDRGRRLALTRTAPKARSAAAVRRLREELSRRMR